MIYTFHLWVTIFIIVFVLGVILGFDAYLILLERKIAAWVQDRLGPNRVGPFGLFQPMADGLKMFLKEDIIPGHVDRVFYVFAPAVAMGTALLAFAVVPFGPTTPPPLIDWPQTTVAAKVRLEDPELQKALVRYENSAWQGIIAPHVDIGILFTFAASSLAVYGLTLGGWSSNNKYSFMGGLRASAQLISYEIPLGMSVLGVIILTGSLNLEQVIGRQLIHGWNIFYQPLGFLIFLTGMFAECNRVPFDIVEAEQELVGGFHTEYSAMKFGLFFLGEYTHMITTSFMLVTLFFGGWQLPWLAEAASWAPLKLIVFLGKMWAVIVVYMLVRWTILRFRFDQLMALAWKGLIPLALLNLVVLMVVVHLAEGRGWSNWLQMGVLFLSSAVLLIGVGALGLLGQTEPMGMQRVGRTAPRETPARIA